MLNITSPYEFLLNGFRTIWNWLSSHGISIGELHVSFLHLALFFVFIRMIFWVFPFFGDPDDDDE